VESGGAWQAAGRSGHVRAVVQRTCSHEHCYDSLFVEWLANDGGEISLVTRKPVEEVGDQTRVSRMGILPSPTGARLEVTHEAESKGRRWTRCFRLGAPGSYVASQGACRKAG
jgi:hypothetical protein